MSVVTARQTREFRGTRAVAVAHPNLRDLARAPPRLRSTSLFSSSEHSSASSGALQARSIPPLPSTTYAPQLRTALSIHMRPQAGGGCHLRAPAAFRAWRGMYGTVLSHRLSIRIQLTKTKRASSLGPAVLQKQPFCTSSVFLWLLLPPVTPRLPHRRAERALYPRNCTCSDRTPVGSTFLAST